jgi:hypothetical protein
MWRSASEDVSRCGFVIPRYNETQWTRVTKSDVYGCVAVVTQTWGNTRRFIQKPTFKKTGFQIPVFPKKPVKTGFRIFTKDVIETKNIYTYFKICI